MGSSTMCPFTLGAMPTKLARTVASSVSGRVSHCQTATATAIAAPTRMSAPTRRPKARRHAGGLSSRSVMGSATEHAHPDDHGEKDHQTRVHKNTGSQVRVDPRAGEELPEQYRSEDTEHEGRHPGWKVRARHGDVRAGPAPREPGAGHGHHDAAGATTTRERAERAREGDAHTAYLSLGRGVDGAVPPVLKASVTDASRRLTFVSTS